MPRRCGCWGWQRDDQPGVVDTGRGAALHVPEVKLSLIGDRIIMKPGDRSHTGVIPAPTEPISMSEAQRRALFMMASVLLDYPDDGWEHKLRVVHEQAATLPAGVEKLLQPFFAFAYQQGQRGLEEHYVSTFDQRRRCSLFLTYYAVGDTRQRGAAIWAFKEALESMSFTMQRDELPDHLCVVLEAAALADDQSHSMACGMLSAHRDGIEVLRTALEHAGSPYAGIVTAICAALPPIDDATRENFLELIRSGPPAEVVGIESPLPFPTSQPGY